MLGLVIISTLVGSARMMKNWVSVASWMLHNPLITSSESDAVAYWSASLVTDKLCVNGHYLQKNHISTFIE